MLGFERVRPTNFGDRNLNNVSVLQGDLDSEQLNRLAQIKRNWNFYEGYHWEDIPEQDTAELTYNYCRAFVNKFVSFELGKGFTFSAHPKYENTKVTEDGRTLFEYLEDVWEDNNQYKFCTDIGQMKSVTGEAWVKVEFLDEDEIDDPYREYPKGRLKLNLIPTGVVFPEYDPHDRDKLVKLSIIYEYRTVKITPVLGRKSLETLVYKQVWTKDKCYVNDGINEPKTYQNKYGFIPFVCIKNVTIAGQTDGVSDLEDIIPLNTEYNLKKSNISEIIDYHSAPVTIVYGAKVGNLEKGANKMWGGLSKDSRVENLELKGDGGTGANYLSDLKLAMCEIGGVPETVLGGASAISNTSGVALQYINMPLIEKTRYKKVNTEDGLERLNKMILVVSMLEGLITKPEDAPNRDFLHTEVSLPDTLPKDELLLINQLKAEMSSGLESRKGAAKRLGKENIEELFKDIDEDKEEHPEFYGGTVKSGSAPDSADGDDPNIDGITDDDEEIDDDDDTLEEGVITPPQEVNSGFLNGEETI